MKGEPNTFGVTTQKVVAGAVTTQKVVVGALDL